MKFLQVLFLSGIVLFFGFIGAISTAPTLAKSVFRLSEMGAPLLGQLLDRQEQQLAYRRNDLDRVGEILRNLEKHDEQMARQQLEHQEMTDAERLQELRLQQDQLRREQDRKAAQERLKKIGAAVYSVVCGAPALVIVWLVFLGQGTIPPETANWAYATLGAIGTFWIGG
jgi:hypothetical protein